MDERIVHWIAAKYCGLATELSERARRRWAAVEAVSLGRGGISAVSAATGLAHTTIHRGIQELNVGSSLPEGRQRRMGAGRQALVERDPGVKAALERLVEPDSRGDPESPLRWTCQSTRSLAKELTAQGHPVDRPAIVEAGWLQLAGESQEAGRAVAS
jgi:hypothetical protein